jgi:hypothetical protein
LEFQDPPTKSFEKDGISDPILKLN